MAWLDTHTPNQQQFRCPRRERPSGVIGVHTAESFPDESGIDSGAENVAFFIQRRSNHGSYHDLCDSDSIIQLVEYRCVAYHIATHGLNEHSYGVSAATQAHRWDDLNPRWVAATIHNMARASARYAAWIKRHYGVTIPARRITLAQARNREPGFLAHADADPDRRSDPGQHFPWDMFLADYAVEIEEDMRLDNEDREWLTKQMMATARTVAGNYHLSGFIDINYIDGQPITRDQALERAAKFAGFSANTLKWDVVPELAAIRAAVGGEPVDTGALAQDLAALLLPEVRDEVRAELANVDGVDEDDIAELIVFRIGSKLSANTDVREEE